VHWNKTISISVAEKLFKCFYGFVLVFDVTNNNTDTYFLDCLFVHWYLWREEVILNFFMFEVL